VADGSNKTQLILGVLALVGVLGAALVNHWRGGGDSGASPSSNAATQVPSQQIKGDNNIQVAGSNNIVNPPATPRACRDKSHGVERYAKTFVHEEKSNWMGGGYSQDPWCNDVIGRLRGENPEAEFKVLAKSEDKKDTCSPFNCPQYQYYCKVQVDTDPVYIEKLDSACK
jgi:hypothetical protein